MDNFITNSKNINGVKYAEFVSFEDKRGVFRETFRAEWFPEVDWTKIQANRSDSEENILRGLHFHKRQYDYWLVPRGSIRVGLCDLRESQSTYMNVELIQMGSDEMLGLLIPPGVAHGFVTLAKSTVNYLVNNYYDGDDEHGVMWNDTELSVPWGIDNPRISDRDKNNPPFKDLSPEIKPI